jgi:hypothetical protein
VWQSAACKSCMSHPQTHPLRSRNQTLHSSTQSISVSFTEDNREKKNPSMRVNKQSFGPTVSLSPILIRVTAFLCHMGVGWTHPAAGLKTKCSQPNPLCRHLKSR